MKPIKTIFLLTAILLCCFTTDVGAQVPQKFPASLFLKEVSATNNSTNLNNSYVKLKPTTQRVGIGLGNINPRGTLDVRGTLYDSCKVGTKEYIFNSGLTNRFNITQSFYTLDYTDTTTWGYFSDANGKVALMAYQKLTAPGIPAHEIMTGDGFARMGYERNNTFKFGVQATNNYTIVNGYTDATTFVVADSSFNNLFTVRTNGNVGVGVATPIYPLEVVGTSAATHFICTQNASVMSATTDTGAGSGASITVTGNDHAGSIQLTAGTGCANNAIVATITYHAAFPSGFSSVVITPKNLNAAAISGNKSVYVTPSDTDFDINAGTTALSDGATYAWNYVVLR